MSEKEKHKHKDKKRKENGEDDKEAKKEKKDKKKEKKDKEKDKEKEAADAKAKAMGMMGVPKPVDAASIPTTVEFKASSKFSDKPPPEVQKELEIQAQKRLKTWQDDELEVDSGDEGSTKLQTLSSVAAQSLGHGATGSTSSPTKAQDADSLDAYMLDIAKERPGVTNEDKEAQESQQAGMPMQMQRKPEGMSVMDSARVKTVTLEDILALMGGGASSSSSKPPEEPMIQEVASIPAPTTAEVQAVDAAAPEETVSEEQEEAFHAAFMAQMRKHRGEGKAVEDVIDDGSDTGEEWDEDRKERERKRMEKLQAKWKAKDERAAARQTAREARLAAGEEEADISSDHSSDSDEASKTTAVVEAKGPLTKKEKRRIRREQKLKENDDKEEAAKQLKKKTDGKEEEEQLHSDADGSEDSEMEKPAESYFDLVKRYTTKKTLPVIDHATMDYKTFTKNLYVQVKEITAMKDHEVDDFRKTNGEIQVRGKNCPRPIKSFLQCGLPEKVLKLLEKRECTVPFPIQMQAIPALMCGRDMIGVAQTGSGKTMAYLLPMIRHALAQLPTRASDDGPVGFIIAPTRELALQISRECNVLCKACNMRCVCAFGGGPMGEQLSALKKGTEILVGTPGRLIDVLTTSGGKITNLRLITFLVLDEADRMFDMGFEPQIGMFLQATRPDKQVAMLSATLPTHVEALARQCLKKPIEITVGERNTAAINITQKIEVVEEGQKFYRLLQLLGEWNEHGSVIIFVHQQRDVDEMFTELLKFGYPALALHGGQDQADRDFTVQDFKDGVANILVATSVAARGLDVKKVILVVNFKVPDHLEDYIHRIGRTGRAGKPGFAYTFIQPDEGDRAQDMLDALRQCGQTVPEKLKRLTEEFQSQVNRGEAKKRRKWGGFGGKGFKYDSTEQSRQQKDRHKAKKESLIGEDFDEEEEEFKDAWNEDKPLSAAARKEGAQDKGKGKGKKGKGKDDDSAKPEVTKETPKNTGEAAAQIAERLKAELEAKERLPEAAAGTPAAAAPQPAGTLMAPTLFAPTPLGGAPKGKAPAVVKKTDEELDAEAQAKAEEVLKNLSEEMRAEKLPKLKEKLKAKLIKENEVASTTERPGPPKPPEAPQEETPLMKATSVVPGVLGIPSLAGGASSMVSRSIQSLADGILKDPARQAAEAAEIAARLGNPNMACPAGMFMEELEINDYPQVARQKISHREPLLQIEEITGSKVQVRGQYFANPSKMPEGARLLYVECIGPTAIAATKAKYEVHKMMEALAIRTLNIPGSSRAVMGTPGRYDPATGK